MRSTWVFGLFAIVSVSANAAGSPLFYTTDKTASAILYRINHDQTITHTQENKIVFTIHPDGRVEFGPGFTTRDDASKRFFESLGVDLAKCKEIQP